MLSFIFYNDCFLQALQIFLFFCNLISLQSSILDIFQKRNYEGLIRVSLFPFVIFLDICSLDRSSENSCYVGSIVIVKTYMDSIHLVFALQCQTKKETVLFLNVDKLTRTDLKGLYPAKMQRFGFNKFPCMIYSNILLNAIFAEQNKTSSL